LSVKVMFRLVLAAVLAAAGLAVLVPTAAQAATVRVMPLGDSITGSPGCWRAYLWRSLQQSGQTNVDLVGSLNNSTSCGFSYDGDNEGHGGFLVTNVAADGSFRNWVNAANPDIILMHFGTNDVWSNKTPAQITGAFGQIVDQARAKNPRVKFIVAKILPMAPSNCSTCAAGVIALNNAIPGWASAKTTSASPITVVDQWTGWNPSTLTVDGVHPNDAGHQRMAAVWYPALVAALAGGTTTTTTSSTSSGGTASNGYPYCANGSASDPDGDGWGWENSASCVVRGSKADPGSATSTTTSTTTTRTTTTTATTSTTSTTSRTTSGGGSGACSAAYTVANAWAGGFVANVTVTAGTAGTRSWRVAVTLPAGSTVTSLWNGVASGTSGTVQVANAGYNGALGAGQSTSFGFQGSGSGSGVTVSCTAG
jgi:lysophospholipase L1-like esterase